MGHRDGTRRGMSGARRPGVEGLESRRLLAVSFGATPVATTITNDSQVTVGPDLDLWFTGQTGGSGTINRYNPLTQATESFPTPGGYQVAGITKGNDANLWFTAPGISSIGVFSPTTHASAIAPTPTAASQPTSIAAAGDGSLWFTEKASGKIGEFIPATSTFHEFPLSNAASQPSGIILGPDGDLWFTETASNLSRVGKINPTTGAVTEFAVQSNVSAGLTVGRDGQVWFGEGNSISEINPATGTITDYTAFSGFPSEPAFASGSFAVGPDGNVWFATYSNGLTIGRAAPSPYLGEIDTATHAVTYFATPQTVGVNYFSPAALVRVGGALEYLADGPSGGEIGTATPLQAGEAAVQGLVYLANSTTAEAGRTVYVDLNGDGVDEPGEPSAVTDANGYFSIATITPGTYSVRVATFPVDYSVNALGQPVTPPTLTLTGDRLVTAPYLAIQPSSSILPLSPASFGANNPDVSTAEVTGLYNTILERAPDAPGLAFWSGQLKSGAATLTQVASAFLHSTEYDSRVIASYYQNFLGRSASPAEITSWVSFMRQGGLTEEQVAYDFLSSPAYSAIYGTDAAFVQSMYQNVLGRTGSAAEVSGWVNYLQNGGTRAGLARTAIAASDTMAVQGFDAIILGWAPYPSGDAVWVASLQKGLTLADVAADFFGSSAYIRRANATVA